MKCLLFTSTLSFLVISALASPTSDGRELNRNSRQATEIPLDISTEEQKKPLQFSERTGKNVELSNNFRTARRKDADEDFEGGRVITNRALGFGEMFEVILEKLNSIWYGSIKIGVVPYSPDNIDFEWDIFISRYGAMYYSDYDAELKVGDRIGVMNHGNGTIDVFINGELRASYRHVPETVYGYVDLYGRAEQATIQLIR